MVTIKWHAGVVSRCCVFALVLASRFSSGLMARTKLNSCLPLSNVVLDQCDHPVCQRESQHLGGSRSSLDELFHVFRGKQQFMDGHSPKPQSKPISPTTVTEKGTSVTPTRPSTPPSLTRSGTKPRRLARCRVLHRRAPSWRRVARTVPATSERGSTGMVRTAHSMVLRRSRFADRKSIACPVRGGTNVCAPRRRQRPDRSLSFRANALGVSVSPTG